MDLTHEAVNIQIKNGSQKTGFIRFLMNGVWASGGWDVVVLKVLAEGQFDADQRIRSAGMSLICRCLVCSAEERFSHNRGNKFTFSSAHTAAASSLTGRNQIIQVCPIKTS